MTVAGKVSPLVCASLLLVQLISLCLGSHGHTTARVEVFLQEPGIPEYQVSPGGVSYVLPGALLGTLKGRNAKTGQEQGSGLQRDETPSVEVAQGTLKLVADTEMLVADEESWIGVVPVGEEHGEVPIANKEESFTAKVVNRMKRALVLGASALLLLALNQSTVRELDVSQVLSKPVIVIQASENVTKLLHALLRGLRATTKITYKAALLENLGVTLTLWSTCGRSRGGLYGEWQGVICTGETSSQVQKYLQQLWNTVLLVSLIVCTGVIIVQVQRQSRLQISHSDPELDLRQHILSRLSALKTRRYHPPKYHRTRTPDIENCAVCLDQFHKNQCLRVLPCLHQFHRDCVDPWLLLQYTCPLCKYNILGNFCRET